MSKLIIQLICLLPLACLGNNYYLSAEGNDDLDGKSIKAAWRSLSKVNNYPFTKGDSLFLQGGNTFQGSLSFEANGNSLENFTITVYDSGKAIIESGNSSAIYLVNSSKITISNLSLVGGGYNLNDIETHGIEIKCENATAPPSDYFIDSIDASGFGGNGIHFNVMDSVFGFINIRITNCVLHENGLTGLFVNGYWDNDRLLISYINKSVYVGHTIAFKNHGRSSYKDNWSGSGILVAGTENGIIEYCEAYENGAENGSLSSGPVGIWTDDSKNVTIQYCISHHNKGGKAKKDGGGFDIDGGTTGCVVQYCTSYENEGPGYSMFQWNTGNKWIYDTIRFNTSTNDGRNNFYGSISAWGLGAAYQVNEAEVYSNHVNLDKKGKAIGFVGSYFNNIRIHNNQFCLENGAEFCPDIPSKVYITDNVFHCGQIYQGPPDSIGMPIDTTTIDTIPAPVDKRVLFEAFPNPAHNVININLKNVEKGEYVLRVVNISGLTVYSRSIIVSDKFEYYNINIGKLSNGIYLLQISGRNNQMMQKMLVQ